MTASKRIATFVAALLLALPLLSAEGEKPRFHHVHLNAVDPAATIDYYQRFFGAASVKFRGVADALRVDRSFLLLTKVDAPAPWELESGIYHIGWGGVDGPSDFKWRDEAGVQWETPLSSLGNEHYMYAYGPDREVIEVWTGFRHHRFGHVHLLSDDVALAHRFYRELLGLNGPDQVRPRPPEVPDSVFDQTQSLLLYLRYLWMSQLTSENDVTLNIFAKPTDALNWWNYEPLGELVPTDGRAVDHIAFSYRDIQPVLERLQAADVEIVEGVKLRQGLNMKSFFVRGPDKVLVEIVEARVLPDGTRETDAR